MDDKKQCPQCGRTMYLSDSWDWISDFCSEWCRDKYEDEVETAKLELTVDADEK